MHSLIFSPLDPHPSSSRLEFLLISLTAATSSPSISFFPPATEAGYTYEVALKREKALHSYERASFSAFERGAREGELSPWDFEKLESATQIMKYFHGIERAVWEGPCENRPTEINPGFIYLPLTTGSASEIPMSTKLLSPRYR